MYSPNVGDFRGVTCIPDCKLQTSKPFLLGVLFSASPGEAEHCLEEVEEEELLILSIFCIFFFWFRCLYCHDQFLLKPI